MKKVSFALLILLSSLTLLAQSEEEVLSSKKVTYGISLGLNHTALTQVRSLPGVPISEGLGFHLGILGDIKITNSFSFSPRAEIAFNGASVDITLLDNTVEKFDILPISINVMGHFIYRREKSKTNPYYYVGMAHRFPVMVDSPNTLQLNSIYALDVGIGLERLFPYFFAGMDLRFSMGLVNVQSHSNQTAINQSQISLVFNFRG